MSSKDNSPLLTDGENLEKADGEASLTRYDEWAKPLIAEFLGTLLFAFTHCMGPKSLPVVGVALQHGFFLSITVVSIGHISGAHVNPAVTVGSVVCGYVKWAKGLLYIGVHLIGSVCGAGLAKVALGSPSGAFTLGEGVTIGQGVLTEVLMTLLLVFTVLQTAMDLNKINAASAIGFSVVVNILIGSNISGGCMNPSLSFGPAVVSGTWQNHWIYWVAPIVGSLIAAAIHKFALATTKNRAALCGCGAKKE